MLHFIFWNRYINNKNRSKFVSLKLFNVNITFLSAIKIAHIFTIRNYLISVLIWRNKKATYDKVSERWRLNDTLSRSLNNAEYVWCSWILIRLLEYHYIHCNPLLHHLVLDKQLVFQNIAKYNFPKCHFLLLLKL